MQKIALIFPNEYLYAHNYFRQFITPNGDDIWMNTKFSVNPEFGDFDAAIVIQSTKGLDCTYTLRCPPTKTLLVLKEPPDILFLPEAYTRQFYCSLGQDKRVKSRIRILSHSGHHWFIEINIRDALINKSFTKTKLLSTVVSNKTSTPGHRKRLEFMYAIKKHFGEQLDWYGRGINEIKDGKIHGLANYKYHIVLENGCWPHYWTEKLADAFVANCFPFYWGASNITDYFSPQSLRKIDIDDIEGAINIIEKAIDQDLYEASQSEILSARKKILSEYHSYEVYLNVINQLPESTPTLVNIMPHTQFRYDISTRWHLRISKYLNLL